MFVFLSYWKNFVGTEKRVCIIHGKPAIRVRAIEVILFLAVLVLNVEQVQFTTCSGVHKLLNKQQIG